MAKVSVEAHCESIQGVDAVVGEYLKNTVSGKLYLVSASGFVRLDTGECYSATLLAEISFTRIRERIIIDP